MGKARQTAEWLRSERRLSPVDIATREPDGELFHERSAVLAIENAYGGSAAKSLAGARH